MKRDAGGEAIAAVQSYIHYLQRLGLTELPVTLALPVRTEAAALPAPPRRIQLLASRCRP